MSFVSRWAVLSGLLFLPAFYFAGSMVLAQKASTSAGSVIALAPYAAAILLAGAFVKGRGSWGSIRGVLAAPIVGAGVAALVAIAYGSIVLF